MRRLSVTGLLLVACCCATGSALAQETSPQPETPALSAAVETCSASVLPAGRVVAFVGSMPASRGATRMRMRFDLERIRPSDRTWRRMRSVAGFGAWESSAPARAGFVFHKRVDGLMVPAGYRAVIHFQWLNSAGKVVRRALRHTMACTQSDLRPNLLAGTLTANFDTRPGLAVYTLLVRNSGRSAAGAFSVSVAGATAEVDGLAAKERRLVTVSAPICLAGTTLRAEVDADHRVDESQERGNAVTRRCPLWGG